MNLDLNLEIHQKEVITETLPVPISPELKRRIDDLKRVCGKSVNEKIREFMWTLVDQNKDKFKAS